MTQVIRVISLRKALNEVLKPIHPNINYETADEMPYPYAVYLLDDSVDDGLVETFSLEIDAWDQPPNGDTTRLEQLIGRIDNALNRLVISRDGLSFRFYRQNRRPVRDPNSLLRRRQLIYQIKVMGVNR